MSYGYSLLLAAAVFAALEYLKPAFMFDKATGKPKYPLLSSTTVAVCSGLACLLIQKRRSGGFSGPKYAGELPNRPMDVAGFEFEEMPTAMSAAALSPAAGGGGGSAMPLATDVAAGMGPGGVPTQDVLPVETFSDR